MPPLILGAGVVVVFLTIRFTYYVYATPDVLDFRNLALKEDFNLYYAAAVLFSRRAAIYCGSLRELFPIGFEWHPSIPGITNPPPLILLTWPLAALPPQTAWAVWSILMLASMLVASYVLFREFRPNASRRQCLAVLILSLLSFPMLSSIRYGQVQPLLLLLVVLGWAQLRHGKIRGAVFWGVAIGLKVFLWPLAFLFIRRRYWQVLAILGSSTLATLWLPTLINPHANWWDFQRCAVPIISYGGETISANVGVLGIFQRMIFFAGIDQNSVRVPQIIPPILAGLIVVALGLRSRTSAKLDGSVAPALAIAVLLAPVTWPHYYPLLLPLFLHSWRHGAWSDSRAAVLLVAWALLPYAPVVYYDSKGLTFVSIVLSIVPVLILFGTAARKATLNETPPIRTPN